MAQRLLVSTARRLEDGAVASVSPTEFGSGDAKGKGENARGGRELARSYSRRAITQQALSERAWVMASCRLVGAVASSLQCTTRRPCRRDGNVPRRLISNC